MSSSNAALNEDHPVPQGLAVNSKSLWAYRIPERLLGDLDGPELVVIRVRGTRTSMGETSDSGDAVRNKRQDDDAGTFLSGAEKSTDGVDMDQLVAVVGFVLDNSAIIDLACKRGHSQQRDAGHFRMVSEEHDTANVGLVVKPLMLDSQSEGFQVLTAREDELCYPKPLRGDITESNIAWLRRFLVENDGALASVAKDRFSAIKRNVTADINSSYTRRSQQSPSQSGTGVIIASKTPAVQRHSRPLTPVDVFLKYTLQRIYAVGRLEGNDDCEKLAEALGEAAVDKDLGPDHWTVSQLLHQRDRDFTIWDCRDVEKACKILWPGSVNDRDGIFKAPGLYSLAAALRRKKQDGTRVADYISYVPSQLWKGLVYTYTALFWQDGHSLIMEPEHISERRLRIVWDITNELPQGTPYGTPPIDSGLSEGSALKTLRQTYDWNVLSIHSCTNELFDGFRVMDVGFGAEGLSVPDAMALRERGLDTRATEDLTVAAIEQDMFIKTVAWVVLPMLNTWKDMTKIIRNRLSELGEDVGEDEAEAVGAGPDGDGDSIMRGANQEDAHQSP